MCDRASMQSYSSDSLRYPMRPGAMRVVQQVSQDRGSIPAGLLRS